MNKVEESVVILIEEKYIFVNYYNVFFWDESIK